MFAVVANPPDAGNCLQTGTAGAGRNLITATLGAFFRFGYRRCAISDKLTVRALIYHLPLLYPQQATDFHILAIATRRSGSLSNSAHIWGKYISLILSIVLLFNLVNN